MRDRREVLKSAVAMVAFGGSAYAAPLDVELVAAEKEVDAAMLEWQRLLRISCDLQTRFFAMAPRALQRSSFLQAAPAELVEEYGRLTVHDLSRLGDAEPDHPFAKWNRLAQEHYNAQAAVADRIDAERDRIDDEIGMTAAEEAANEASNKANALARSLIEIPATGVAGVVVKLRVHTRWMGDDPDVADVLLSALRADLGRITGTDLADVGDARI